VFKIYKVGLILAVLGFLSACGTTMPLTSGTKSVDTSSKSILVGRLAIKNINRKGHQPQLTAVVTEKNGKNTVFTKPYLLSEVKKEGKEYIFSVTAEPGEAKLKWMNFLRSAFLITATATLPFERNNF